jgi:hypothetical protein
MYWLAYGTLLLSIRMPDPVSPLFGALAEHSILLIENVICQDLTPSFQ